jgi:hypothetical protein
MAQDALQVVYVSAAFEFLSRERVPQCVRRYLAEPCCPGILLQYEPESLPSQPLTTVVQKQRLALRFTSKIRALFAFRERGPALLQVFAQRFQCKG